MIVRFLLASAVVLVLVLPGTTRAEEPPERERDALPPLLGPDLVAAAASPDRESAARALRFLLADRSSERALLRLLEAGTTQDRMIALHFAAHPDPLAADSLSIALERHREPTATAQALATALRACVPEESAPPTADGEEDVDAWRAWAARHHRERTAACLGRTSVSLLPLAWMILSGALARRREGPRAEEPGSPGGGAALRRAGRRSDPAEAVPRAPGS